MTAIMILVSGFALDKTDPDLVEQYLQGSLHRPAIGESEELASEDAPVGEESRAQLKSYIQKFVDASQSGAVESAHHRARSNRRPTVLIHRRGPNDIWESTGTKLGSSSRHLLDRYHFGTAGGTGLAIPGGASSAGAISPPICPTYWLETLIR